jgi:hypothetical protein
MLTSDGLFLYAETLVPSQGHYEISQATRANTQSSFSAFQAEPMLNTAANEGGPTVLPDGSRIYYSRDGELLQASRSGSTWTPPVPVSGFNANSSSNEGYPLISADDLTLYFSSDRPGGLGTDDIYVARRTSVVMGFGAPVPLAEVNSAMSEAPSWISADGCEFWLTRVAPGSNNNEIYVARRPR